MEAPDENDAATRSGASPVSVGAASDCNTQWRRTMEDTHVFMHDFGGVQGQTYMAVFDGHAGKFAAEWCRDHLHEYVAAEMAARPDAAIPEVFNAAFLEADDELTRAAQSNTTRSGCTAVVALVRDESAGEATQRMLYVANVGDARAVLRRGASAIRLSYDHKGSDALEIERVMEQGGFIHANRVNGVLAVTRSLGDHLMKDYVMGTPFTSAVRLTPEDSLLVMACDGLWDIVSDQLAVDLAAEHSATDAAETLQRHALENYCTDNITVLVARFD